MSHRTYRLLAACESFFLIVSTAIVSNAPVALAIRAFSASRFFLTLYGNFFFLTFKALRFLYTHALGQAE
jgi:hypothetical protein